MGCPFIPDPQTYPTPNQQHTRPSTTNRIHIPNPQPTIAATTQLQTQQQQPPRLADLEHKCDPPCRMWRIVAYHISCYLLCHLSCTFKLFAYYARTVLRRFTWKTSVSASPNVSKFNDAAGLPTKRQVWFRVSSQKYGSHEPCRAITI